MSKTISEETRRKISETMKGHKASEYVKQRASETHRGKVTSDETKRKQSEAHKKAVKITNEQTGEVFIYNSQKEAEDALGFARARISFIIHYQQGHWKHWLIESI